MANISRSITIYNCYSKHSKAYIFKEELVQNTNPTRPSNHHEAPHHTPASTSRATKRAPFGWIAFGVAILTIIVLVIIAISLIRTQPTTGAMKGEIKKDQYQAVFLTNGQVYFGKIRDITNESLKLEEVYYLQVQDPVQPADKNKQQSQNLSLLKLGGEIHGPENMMVITREQTLFWENLSDDGKVVQAIKQAKK